MVAAAAIQSQNFIGALMKLEFGSFQTESAIFLAHSATWFKVTKFVGSRYSMNATPLR
jgi:hypothetical protein